jgi:hypothetical protein
MLRLFGPHSQPWHPVRKDSRKTSLCLVSTRSTDILVSACPIPYSVFPIPLSPFQSLPLSAGGHRLWMAQ